MNCYWGIILGPPLSTTVRGSLHTMETPRLLSHQKVQGYLTENTQFRAVSSCTCCNTFGILKQLLLNNMACWDIALVLYLAPVGAAECQPKMINKFSVVFSLWWI